MAQPYVEARRSKAPILILVVVVAVAAAAAYFLVLKPKDKPKAAPAAKVSSTTKAGSPSSTKTAAPVAPGGASTTSTIPASPGKAAPAPAGGQVQETFQIYEVKNPFLPLISEGSGAPGAGGSSGAPAPSGSGAPATTSPPAGSSAPSQGPGTGTGSGGAVEPNQGTRVAMLEAPFTDGGRLVANIRVGSSVYKVGAGDTFATSFKVVSLDGSCGKFLFGDNSFSLCTGQEVLK